MKQHYEQAEVAEIARSLGLDGIPELVPTLGMVNGVWRLDDTVIRICIREDAERDALIEETYVPMAVAAGVLTPELLHVDHSCRWTEGSFTVYRRVHGVTLGALAANLLASHETFVEIGKEFAKLHSLPKRTPNSQLLTKAETDDFYEEIGAARDAGIVDELEAKQLTRWADRLTPFREPMMDTVIHNDLHPWNVIVDPKTQRLVAIIDWGDAGYGHPAMDFIGTPLWCIAPMLLGYLEEGGNIDNGFIPVLLWQWLANSLWDGRSLGAYKVYRRDWWRWPLGGFEEVKSFLQGDPVFGPWLP